MMTTDARKAELEAEGWIFVERQLTDSWEVTAMRAGRRLIVSSFDRDDTWRVVFSEIAARAS